MTYNRAITHGLIDFSAKQDRDGHRTYEVDWLVEVDDPYFDGPYVAANAAGLPPIGSVWVTGNDYDPYAFCTPEMKVARLNSDQGELSEFFVISQVFTTRPLNKDSQSPENPLLVPPEVSGSFVQFTREASRDKDGNPLKSSSLERFIGAAVERDYGNHQVTIKVNSATLPLATWMPYMHSVNSAALWGLSARMVKLSNVSWRRAYYGASYTSVYYEVTFDFDINFETFDRYILDEGTRVLKDGGNPEDPKDFKPFTIEGQPSNVLLDGAGKAITSLADQYYWQGKLYAEKNLLLLPIPSAL